MMLGQPEYGIPPEAARRLRVLVNGVPILSEDVIEVSEGGRGRVVRYARRADGRLEVAPHNPDEFLLEQVVGDVRVVVPVDPGPGGPPFSEVRRAWRALVRQWRADGKPPVFHMQWPRPQAIDDVLTKATIEKEALSPRPFGWVLTFFFETHSREFGGRPDIDYYDVYVGLWGETHRAAGDEMIYTLGRRGGLGLLLGRVPA